MKQNLPGGLSAVVPPDPMPNSEVKRRSADGSVGSPHARVGNCQASNKTKGSVERLGLLFYLLFVGERSPNQDKSAGSGFERCEATARRVAGRTPAINCQASNLAEGHPSGWPFCVGEKNAGCDAGASSPAWAGTAGAAYSPTYARFSNGYGFPKSSTSERPVTLNPIFL